MNGENNHKKRDITRIEISRNDTCHSFYGFVVCRCWGVGKLVQCNVQQGV